MPTINVTPVTMSDGTAITQYNDTVKGTQTFTFLTEQEALTLRNKGTKDITYTVNTHTGTLVPSQSVSFTESITSFMLTTVSGTQAFEVRSDQAGTIFNTSGQQNGNINQQLEQLALGINNYSVIPTYENGQLTKVEEKDGDVVKSSSTITYNADGTANTVTEVINGQTVVMTMNYVNGEFSSVSKVVQ